MKKQLIAIDSLQVAENRENQIKAWKAEFGEIFYFKLGENKECYLRKPTRQEVSYASMAATTDPMAYNDSLLSTCWLAGHEEIKTDTGLFLSISQKLTDMIGIVEVEMVKL